MGSHIAHATRHIITPFSNILRVTLHSPFISFGKSTGQTLCTTDYGEQLLYYGEELLYYGEQLLYYGEQFLYHGEDFCIGEDLLYYGEQLLHYGEQLLYYGEDFCTMLIFWP